MWTSYSTYMDTNGDPRNISRTGDSQGTDPILAFEKGALSRNIGLNMAIVCTKVPRLILKLTKQSDLLGDHEKKLGSDQLDYIQQALRTLCLKCK